MMISAKGRYALIVMVDLAQHKADGYVPLKDIAARQGISLKYLESIMGVLSKAGYVDALHGKGGGYRLNRTTDEYTVGGVIKLTESSLAPVPCLEDGAEKCEREAECPTCPVWQRLYTIIDDYLESVTLSDLMRN